MTCQEVIDFLSDYVDGTLPWRQRALFLVHLGLCRDCRNYVASFHHTKLLLRATAQEVDANQLPPFPPELLQAIEAARK
jgi:predicted anti-sigma-YlaC factor YlaD